MAGAVRPRPSSSLSRKPAVSVAQRLVRASILRSPPRPTQLFRDRVVPFWGTSQPLRGGNVSGAIKNFLAHLLLRQKLHHELPLLGGSRTSGYALGERNISESEDGL